MAGFNHGELAFLFESGDYDVILEQKDHQIKMKPDKDRIKDHQKHVFELITHHEHADIDGERASDCGNKEDHEIPDTLFGFVLLQFLFDLFLGQIVLLGLIR